MLFTATRNLSWDVELGGLELRFGDDRLRELGALARELGGSKVLLVTDAGIEQAGHAERALETLRDENLEVAVFDEIEENPTTRHVEMGAEAARQLDTDLIVGLGGGSAMDCAKGINFLVTNGGPMENYWGYGKAEKPMLPAIGVPTTAGTGSEAQSYALITQLETHRKMACGDPKARFRAVILDPVLISSMPQKVAAITGIDALSHALESYVTRDRNPISKLYAREAWRLLESSFVPFLADPYHPGARRHMLLGAHLAGAAIECSMLGAAHSCANPLTARFGITHGTAIGLMLPHVVRFNGATVDNLYGELTAASGLNGQQGRTTNAARISQRVTELREAGGLPSRLSQLGVDASSVPELAKEAAKQWTVQFNPRAVGNAELRQIYEAAL